MNLATVLNIAIGLILVYFVCSLLASEIQEIIATIFEWRSKNLKDSIAQILGENNSQDPLVNKLYNNPIIQTLNHKAANQRKSRGPSYIPAQSFATALIEVTAKNQERPDNLDQFINDLENSSELPDNLKRNLRSFAKQAKVKAEDESKNIHQFELEIQNWFDSSMDRASGVYKRNAKGLTLLIACLIAIFANVDTIYIIKSLSQNQALQSSIDQVAGQVIDSSYCFQMSEADVNQADCLSGIKTNLNQAYTKLSPLPLGWDLSDPWKKQFSSLSWNSIITAIIGWLLTGIAITMGAPFWFDLLSNVINVRNTGRKINRH